MLQYLSRVNHILALKVSKKSAFQDYSHLNALKGNKFDLAMK